MKRIILIFSVLFVSYTAHSQILISLLLGDKLNSDGIEFGLEGGLTTSNINGFNNDGALNTFLLGFYFDIRVQNNFYLHTGVEGISNTGMAKLSDQDIQLLDGQKLDYPGKYNEVINAFYVPILAQYRFKNHLYIEAGPQVGWLYNSYIYYTSKYDNRDIKIKDPNKELLNWFDGGISVGAGYRLMKGKGWTIGARYYQGLTNVFNHVSGSKSHALNIVCKIPIGAAPKENKGQADSSD